MRLLGKVAFISGGARGMEAPEGRLIARKRPEGRDRQSPEGHDCHYGESRNWEKY